MGKITIFIEDDNIECLRVLAEFEKRGLFVSDEDYDMARGINIINIIIVINFKCFIRHLVKRQTEKLKPKGTL